MAMVAQSVAPSPTLFPPENNWRIKQEDLEFGKKIAEGFYGEVYRYEWVSLAVAVVVVFFIVALARIKWK